MSSPHPQGEASGSAGGAYAGAPSSSSPFTYQSSLPPRGKGRPSRARLELEAQERAMMMAAAGLDPSAIEAATAPRRSMSGSPMLANGALRTGSPSAMDAVPPASSTSPMLSAGRRPQRSRSGMNLSQSLAESRHSPVPLSQRTAAGATQGSSSPRLGSRSTPRNVARPDYRQAPLPADEDADDDVDMEDGDEQDLGDDDDDDVSGQRRTRRRYKPTAPLMEAGTPKTPSPSPSKRKRGERGRGSSARGRNGDAGEGGAEDDDLEEDEDIINGGWLLGLGGKDSATRAQCYKRIIDKLRAYRDPQGSKLTDELEDCPDEDDDPAFYEKISKPTCLRAILARIDRDEYATPIEFELDMLQLLRNARRYYQIGSDGYGRIMLLHRYYNHVTKHANAAAEPVDDEVKARGFASAKLGPGEEGDHPNAGSEIGDQPKGEVTAFKWTVYKGVRYAPGDWVHLANPSDSSRPIVAQVFKIHVAEDERYPGGPTQLSTWITCSWYLRPEQTVHERNQMFYPDEVLKTPLFVEHRLEDVIEKVQVLYCSRWVKGRPKVENEGEGWDANSPLYICENRFNRDKLVFNKIKNWSQVVPDEIRHKEAPMDFFEAPIAYPNKIISPLLRGVRGPGHFLDGKTFEPIMVDHVSDSNDTFAGYLRLSAAQAHQRAEVLASGTVLLSSPRLDALVKAVAPRLPVDEYRFLLEFLATPELPAEPGVPASAMVPETEAMAAKLRSLDRRSVSSLRECIRSALVTLHIDETRQGGAQPLGIPGLKATPGAVHGISAPHVAKLVESSGLLRRQRMLALAKEKEAFFQNRAYNVLAGAKMEGYYQTLPEETQRLFRRDAETKRVLWYPAPPLDGLEQHLASAHERAPDVVAPQHSLEYLYQTALAQKMRRTEQGSS